MYINRVFTLSMVLDTEKFDKVINHVYADLEYDEGGYIDRSMSNKGITVAYRDSQYKKKITVIVNTSLLTDSSNADKVVRKLNKHISGYFGSRYTLDDFVLSGATLLTDIDVGSRDIVSDYIKVLQRVGKVKNFSPVEYDGIDGYCLDGNSNGIAFMIYDLEPFTLHKGILRAEVRLLKQKAIREYIDTADVENQIAELWNKSQDVFMDIFVRIVPFGDFYKKDEAVEIIRRNIPNLKLRRRMLWLVELIPEKKSLLLAQKALKYRDIDRVMDAFAKIGLSSVTIGKRQDIKQLDNLYSYLM